MEYLLVTRYGYLEESTEFENTVQSYMDYGWRPLGGINCILAESATETSEPKFYWYQTMVKEND